MHVYAVIPYGFLTCSSVVPGHPRRYTQRDLSHSFDLRLVESGERGGVTKVSGDCVFEGGFLYRVSREKERCEEVEGVMTVIRPTL